MAELPYDMRVIEGLAVEVLPIDVSRIDSSTHSGTSESFFTFFSVLLLSLGI